MSFAVHRRAVSLRRARWLTAASLVLVLLAACEPSAPAGFTGSVSPGGGGSVAPGSSVAPPDGSGLVAGKPTVTTDGGKVTVAGLGAGKSATFDLPAGSAEMTVTPCSSNQVNPFVTLYDAKGTMVGLIVDPTFKLANLAGGSYYVDVSANPACVWSILIVPG
jgi:hypothetical protein